MALKVTWHWMWMGWFTRGFSKIEDFSSMNVTLLILALLVVILALAADIWVWQQLGWKGAAIVIGQQMVLDVLALFL